MSISRAAVAVFAGLAIVLALLRLEAGREGIVLSDFAAGTTPATLYQRPGADGPLVVAAHGFGGSRRMMEAYALTLADAGYRVAAFDFEGHGANPVPMSGDVMAIEGTTALLLAETRRVLAAARGLTGAREAALLGHSMASDIVVRAALAEADVAAVVAISMYSEAVTADAPARLLVITGAGEPHLRRVALAALRAVDPSAEEGDTAVAGEVIRRAVVAPGVEHVCVLQSRTALRAARDWIDAAFGRDSAGPVTAPGPGLLLLLGGIVALAWPLSAALGGLRPAPPAPGRLRAAAALLLPTLAVPPALWLVAWGPLPYAGLGHLALHAALFGALQLIVLRGGAVALNGRAILGGLALAAWAIGVFGWGLERYGAEFWPGAHRLAVIAALVPGVLLLMLGDAALAGAGLAWRLAGRTAFVASIALSMALGGGEALFLFLAPPLYVLVLLVFGLPARWVAARAGPGAAGIGLGLVFAWTLGAVFPLYLA